jgi:hypothetical protein
MALGSRIVKTGKQIIMSRVYNVNPRDPPSYFVLGVSNATPTDATSWLTSPIPILDGNVNDTAENTYTVSSGGDNTTDNTTTYKPGGGVSDNTGQNLIANSTNVLKIWGNTSITATLTATRSVGAWIYIKDATTLAKIVNVQLRWGTSPGNYFYITWLNAVLTTGWNWLSTGEYNLVSYPTVGTTGSPGASPDEFYVAITTNNATDTFVAGDVVLDLMRSWVGNDTLRTFDTVTVDETTLEAVMRATIGTTEAVGFAIDGILRANATNTAFSATTIDEQGKGLTDEFVIVARDRHA